ncbi:alpha/beta-Hydrolases superfamily protein [Prunus dulcis]|uniref:Alpha/beta-Hydrolases superfamily protein n=1 Tax=Prunus dulcis TaxID=3755 RepID=A0A4Y1RKQ1_PRUDU|nr:alpha/beta-Hydrolases superfamily protein [Prunus dulcis]
MLALYVNSESTVSTPTPEIKKIYIHPPSAARIMLPDGRYIAYKEQGVPADRARFSIIAPHSFLSSRLAGIPGLKASLLEEFGVRLLSYDIPGFGESDPHPNRNLESSAMDMLLLADAVGINDKFWVVGYSSGSMHAWAALRYIPDRLAGAAMFAPMVNPYDSIMTREERRRTWEKWARSRKFLYFLARRFPRFLSYFYHRSFLSGKHGQIDKWLSLSLGRRDKALIEDPIYEEFWQRDLEESIRQGNVKPFVEEAVLQVSNWGFSLADLKLQKKQQGKGVLNWLKSVLSAAQEEYIGFLGPIHIWQGMDDKVVPPSMTDFVHRILPGVAVHKLPYEGHFTYIYFCDECHRQIFTTLFGTPQGPLDITIEVDQSTLEGNTEEQKEVALGDSVPAQAET